jgi:hypothetical protein
LSDDIENFAAAWLLMELGCGFAIREVGFDFPCGGSIRNYLVGEFLGFLNIPCVKSCTEEGRIQPLVVLLANASALAGG